MIGKTENSNGPNISGIDNLSPSREYLTSALKRWQRKVGYFSMLAAFPAILTSQVQEAHSNAAETDVFVPDTRQSRQSGTGINRNHRRPEFLRRQSEYRLPHQKSQYNILAAFLP